MQHNADASVPAFSLSNTRTTDLPECYAVLLNRPQVYGILRIRSRKGCVPKASRKLPHGQNIQYGFRIRTQYAHMEEILKMGCNVIEMETASAFRAAQTAGLKLAALYSVSDNTVLNKSLLSGRTEQDMQYRRFVRANLFTEILLKVFAECEPQT